MIKQRTLRTIVRATGVGLHTGHKVTMALRPAPIDTGIVFCRSDLPGNPAIPARALNVSNTVMATVLEHEGARVSTVEHLMSAFFLLQSAGIEEQAAPKRFVRILQPIEIAQGDKKVRLEPFNGFKVSFSIEF